MGDRVKRVGCCFGVVFMLCCTISMAYVCGFIPAIEFYQGIYKRTNWKLGIPA